PQLKDPTGDPAIWRDGLDTGILIESVYRWRGEIAEKRPAIMIKRNGRKNLRYLRSDLQGANVQGFENYATAWTGSHTVFCLHATGIAADDLSTEVQRELTQFGPVIQPRLRLMKWQVLEVGEIGIVE